jgi:hypothetical protein
MHIDQLVFSQLMDIIPKYKFRKIVAPRKGDHYVKLAAITLFMLRAVYLPSQSTRFGCYA